MNEKREVRDERQNKERKGMLNEWKGKRRMRPNIKIKGKIKKENPMNEKEERKLKTDIKIEGKESKKKESKKKNKKQKQMNEWNEERKVRTVIKIKGKTNKER